jgi:hypothetical protein
MRTIRLAIAWAALSGFLPTIAPAQNALRPPELQRLSFYVGSWSEAGQMRDDPAKPFKPIAGGTFAPSLHGARTLMVEAGTGDSWQPIANIKYEVRK